MKNELANFKAEFFKALGHPMRIRILEALGQGEYTVKEIQEIVGSEGSTVSQQLAVLRNKNIIYGTKRGTNVIYSLRDPMIKDMLLIVKRIFQNHLVDTIATLNESQAEEEQ